jgi:hypothetical protein
LKYYWKNFQQLEYLKTTYTGSKVTFKLSSCTNHTQYTDVNDYLSNRLTTKNGLPQGSVLGPILFLLYINSIKSLALKGVPYLYADEIAILYSANKYEELKIKMEDDLQLLPNWTAIINISINHVKTKAMLIKSNILLDVRFENVKMDFKNRKCNNFKYLGLILNKVLTFSFHISPFTGDFDLLKRICLNGLFWISFNKTRHLLSKFSTLVTSQKKMFFALFTASKSVFEKYYSIISSK